MIDWDKLITDTHLRAHINEYTKRLSVLQSSQYHLFSEITQNKECCDEPGVYTISLPTDEELIYVGKTRTKSISGRMIDHRNAGTNSDLGGMIKENEDLPRDINEYLVRFVVVTDDRDRLFFEYFAIGCLRPRLNK